MSHEFFFDHHRIEAVRNKVRLRVGLVMIAVVTVAVCAPAFFSHASIGPSNYVDGAKILNSGSGPYGGSTSGAFSSATVTATEVSNGYKESRTSNPFTFMELPATSTYGGDYYVMSVASVPGYTVKGLTWCTNDCPNYDPQKTNFHAGASMQFKFISTVDYHLTWIFQPAVAATPAPTAAPVTAPTSAPKAAVAPAPAPKPANPAPAAASAPAGGAGPKSLAKAAAAPSQPVDQGPPTVPGDFEAVVTGNNAIITLKWSASSAGTGVSYYDLQRSADNVNWTDLGNGHLTALSFLDDQAAFQVHYRYRVNAVSGSGRASDYAVVDAQTGSYVANSGATTTSSYVSEDRIARVEVPAGALSGDASCSVTLNPIQTKLDGRKPAVGPYTFVCKTASGKLITDFLKPVKWTFSLKDKLTGLSDPAAVAVDDQGGRVEIPDAVYDPKLNIISFDQVNTSTVLVAAAVHHAWPVALLVVLGLLVLVTVGIFTVFLRKAQREKYFDHLRAKYYNL